MAVTLQQIAERAGVSRGTVDRALNNRGRIRAELAEEIKHIAEEMGYRPNRAGRALAMAKRSIRIGAIVQEASTPFIQEVIKGIESAKDEVEYMGGTVLVKQIADSDAQKTIRAMEELRAEDVYAIAINPMQDQELQKMIDRFVDEYNIPIVTLNTDLPETRRLCYVGQNSIECGRTAAGLMKEIVKEKGSIAVVSGYPGNPSVTGRVIGFMQEMEVICPELTVLEPRYTFNNDKMAELIAKQFMAEYLDLRAIFISSHAEIGVCRALREHFPDRDVKIIACDILGDARTELMQKQVSFLLEEDPYIQGFEPIMILFRLLFDGKSPEKEFEYTDIIIRTKYNIVRYL